MKQTSQQKDVRASGKAKFCKRRKLYLQLFWKLNSNNSSARCKLVALFMFKTKFAAFAASFFLKGGASLKNERY